MEKCKKALAFFQENLELPTKVPRTEICKVSKSLFPIPKNIPSEKLCKLRNQIPD